MVEIIPKKAPVLPQWLNILFYFSLVILIFSILGYFILGNSLQNNQKNLSNLEKSLFEGRSSERINLEKEILKYQRNTEDFSQLIGKHLTISEVFNTLQKNSHPKVWFSQFNLDAKEAKISVSGESQSFESLGQQLLIFQDENLIKETNLEQVSITKEGKIKFSLTLSLDPQIFKTK